MSLLVWLPLNGDLNNQGLSNAAFAQYNNTGGLGINNSGKISQNCYERTSVTNNAYRSNINFSFAEDVSMCCWAYVSNTPGDSANGLITNHNHVDGSGFGITVKQVSATDYRISCSAGKSGSDRVYHSWYGTTNIKDAWHHLVLTYKRSTGDIKLYVDGICEKTRAGYLGAAIGSNPFDLFNWSTGNISSTNYRPLCKLNDVRLYDHCLSEKEIKEISKGLVCHLPLNGGEGGVNLIKGIAECTATSAGVIALGDDLTYDSSLLPLNSLIGRTFTFTYDYSIEGAKKNATGDYSKDRFGAHLTLIYKDSTGATKTAYPGASYLEASGTGRAIQTYACSSSWTEITSLTIALQGYNQPASGNNNTWYIKNFKIEVGNADTGYNINPNTSGTSVKLTDCSGYGHHGIPSVLPPSYRKDTTRYNTSYDFVGGKKVLISNLPTSGLANSYTISWWAKAWSFSNLMFWGFSNGNRLNYYGGLYCNTGDGSSNPYQNNGTTITVPTKDVWHHYVMVGNGSTSLLYLDGNLYGTALNYRSITGSSIYLNGWDSSSSYNFNGYMSDFRIYTTALSASDVKELYQIPISVDKNGDIFGISFNENGTKHSFYKTGVVEGALWEKDESFNLIKNNTPFKENLFKNSNSFGLTGSDYPSVSTRTVGKVVVSSDSVGNAYAWIQGSIEGGMTSIFNSTKTMTLSIDIKVENVTNANAYGLIAIDYRKGDHSALIQTTRQLIMDGKWHRYILPITANNGGQIQSLLCLANFQNLNGATIYYKNIKYEEGATGSPWCPSKSEGFTSNMATMVAPISANQFYEV